MQSLTIREKGKRERGGLIIIIDLSELIIIIVFLFIPTSQSQPVRPRLWFPWVISGVGGIWQCTVNVVKGKGERLLQGLLDKGCIDTMNAAISFVSINAGVLLSCLPSPYTDHVTLYNKYTDIMVSLSDLDKRWSRSSLGACVATSTIMYLGGCEIMVREIAITGGFDLRGRVHIIGDAVEKIKVAMDDGEVNMMILPQANLDKVNVGNDKALCNYMARCVRGVENIVDIMSLVIKGE